MHNIKRPNRSGPINKACLHYNACLGIQRAEKLRSSKRRSNTQTTARKCECRVEFGFQKSALGVFVSYHASGYYATNNAKVTYNYGRKEEV